MCARAWTRKGKEEDVGVCVERNAELARTFGFGLSRGRCKESRAATIFLLLLLLFSSAAVGSNV